MDRNRLFGHCRHRFLLRRKATATYPFCLSVSDTFASRNVTPSTRQVPLQSPPPRELFKTSDAVAQTLNQL
ncbi:unnamed protein product, partial [Clavelina lepadiformis]